MGYDSTHLRTARQTAEKKKSEPAITNLMVLRNNTVCLDQLHCSLSNAHCISGNTPVTQRD